MYKKNQKNEKNPIRNVVGTMIGIVLAYNAYKVLRDVKKAAKKALIIEDKALIIEDKALIIEEKALAIEDKVSKVLEKVDNLQQLL